MTTQRELERYALRTLARLIDESRGSHTSESDMAIVESIARIELPKGSAR